jgi:hypothetical protein
LNHDAHHLVGSTQTALERFAVLAEIDGEARHAGFNGSLSDCGCLPDEHVRIKRFRDDVLGAKLEAVEAIGAEDGIGHVLFGEGGQSPRGGKLHLIVDGGGPDIERAAENEGEAKDVVHWLGKSEQPVATMASRVVADFRVGIGESEDQRARRYGRDHFRRNRAASRESEEYVGAHEAWASVRA